MRFHLFLSRYSTLLRLQHSTLVHNSNTLGSTSSLFCRHKQKNQESLQLLPMDVLKGKRRFFTSFVNRHSKGAHPSCCIPAVPRVTSYIHFPLKTHTLARILVKLLWLSIFKNKVRNVKICVKEFHLESIFGQYCCTN
jgi:hypothetical protein